MKMCAITTIIVVLCLEKIKAGRTLEEEQWLHKNLLIHTLQRGPVKPSQKNPCSTVPGRNKGHCTLGEINVAGHLSHPPSLFLETLSNFGASLPPSIDANDTPKKGIEINTDTVKNDFIT
ncbi:hypothetical protein VNO77_18517 [Canavalia gladiata]|uniref:Uncharacterized protein n=1 Tax=Canavalia gladiata TaxID=3824 RepID=A0AAN9QHS1_CANGL